MLAHDRVRVRPIRQRDALSWRDVRARNVDWLSPWEATMPPGVPPVTTSFSAMVRDARRQARGGRGLVLVTTYDGRLVGQVTLSSIIWGSARWAQMGYWVDRAVAGRNIAPTAVALTIDECFTGLGLHRIEIAIRPDNQASLRVVEKLGFRQEGRAARYLHINGRWQDHVLFALTTEDVPQGVLARLLQS